ncbi:MAG: hypothetical protein KF824_12600 [Fimbriimonadaceae bacterium]|nr:MAG: hypothetical protein KF824_12600 [Fimbriimonadaceae bacterium]
MATAEFTYQSITSLEITEAQRYDLLVIRDGKIDYRALMTFVASQSLPLTTMPDRQELCNSEAGQYLMSLALRGYISIEVAITLYAEVAFRLSPDARENDLRSYCEEVLGSNSGGGRVNLTLSAFSVIGYLPILNYLAGDMVQVAGIVEKGLSQLDESLIGT